MIAAGSGSKRTLDKVLAQGARVDILNEGGFSAMHFAGKFFPRSDRAPAIVPVSGGRLMDLLAAETNDRWRGNRKHRVNSTFYISEAREVIRR
jgi:hypothetical protein